VRPRILILYFSGTGNTWLMASAIAGEFGKRGFQADLMAIEQTPRNLDVSGYDIVGIGFPVYAWCFPSNVRRFLKRIPQGEGRGAFVFSTVQSSSVGAEALAARYLERRGYRVASARMFLAVNNETIYYGPADPRSPDTLRRLEEMKSQAAPFVTEVLAGDAVLERNGLPALVFSQLAGMCFDLLDGWPASRNFRINETCTRCGICERICPEGNIYGSLSWPRFRNRCLMCERCVNFCPVKAIVHPLRRVNTDVRYHAPGYRPPLLREPTGSQSAEFTSSAAALRVGLTTHPICLS